MVSSPGWRGLSFTSPFSLNSVFASACCCNGPGCFSPDNAVRASLSIITQLNRFHQHRRARLWTSKNLRRSALQLFRVSDMKLFAAGVSHKTAPVEVREQLAVQRNEIVDLAQYLKWFGRLDEIVLLSTCNRVEIYGTTQQTTRDVKSLFQFLTSEELDIGPHTY